MSLPPWQDGTRRGAISEHGTHWITEDNPPLELQPMEGNALSAANSTTSAPRQRGTAKQATTHGDDQELLWSSRGQPLGQHISGQGGKLAKLNYMDIKNMLDR
jgi:hypothetical protein